MRHSTLVAVFAGVLICGIAQAGDVYKYVDERGNTLYTDRPMPGAVKVSSGNQRPVEVAQRSYAAEQATTQQQLASSNRRIAQTQSESRASEMVAKDLEATRAERCKKAREVYQKSINSRRMYREGQDGQRVYLSDEELAQQRLDAAKAVESICGPQG